MRAYRPTRCPSWRTCRKPFAPDPGLLRQLIEVVNARKVPKVTNDKHDDEALRFVCLDAVASLAEEIGKRLGRAVIVEVDVAGVYVFLPDDEGAM